MKLPGIPCFKLIICSSSENIMRALRHNKLDVYNRIEVSKSALLNNARFFKKRTGLKIIPVIKSNAYGHGIELVAEALKNEDFPLVAVDGYFEALKIRKITKTPILVLGMLKPGDYQKTNHKHIEFTIQDEASIHAIGKLGKTIKVHLDINVGMNRYGIDPDELEEYLTLIASYPKIELAGVMAHIADPEDAASVKEAVRSFDQAVSKILKKGFKPTTIHIGQSASSVQLKSKYANATRIGLSLYGLNPFTPEHGLYKEFKQNLKPALKLVSTISKVNDLKPGDDVSYNHTFRAKKNMQVAVLPLGYYEGVDWRLGNKGKVKFADDYLPIVGKVCMNHTMMDISGTIAKAGDEIIVLSDNPDDENSVDNISRRFGLFNYALVTNLSSDVRRVLV